MKFEITHSPTFAKLDVSLDTGESIIAQPDSMLCMTNNIDVSAKMGGQMQRSGMLSGIKSMFTGEGAFAAIYKSKNDGERISLVPDALGDILQLDLTESSFYLTRGSYLASQETVELTMKYGGVKGILAKKGLFYIHATGIGSVFLASFGAVIKIELAEEEKIVIDNRYVIAFADTIEYEMVKVSKSLKDTYFSGEGFVNRYTGPGVMYYQTRGPASIGGLLTSVVQAAT